MCKNPIRVFVHGHRWRHSPLSWIRQDYGSFLCLYDGTPSDQITWNVLKSREKTIYLTKGPATNSSALSTVPKATTPMSTIVTVKYNASTSISPTPPLSTSASSLSYIAAEGIDEQTSIILAVIGVLGVGGNVTTITIFIIRKTMIP